MDTNLTLHGRQFVLARQAHPISSGWCHVDVGNGWILSHEPRLTVTRNATGFIVGHAVRVGQREHLELSGRFCIISTPWILPDAAGLLNLYFSRGRNDKTDGFVTSSPAIAQLLGARHNPARKLTWSGMNWNPVPGTPLQEIGRLLRDQALNLSDFSISHRNDVKLVPLDSHRSALDTLCSTLETTAVSLEREGILMLALTAGLDSRTLAASLLSSKVRFECFTQNFPGVRPSDVAVASEICRYIGVKHHIIEPLPANNGAVATWSQHTLESYSDADNNQLLKFGLYRFLTADMILIRGGLFEVGRRFYQTTLPNLDYGNATGSSVFRSFERTGADHLAVKSLDAWLDWRRSHDSGLDLSDDFYIDQRVGGWLAAVEQGMDLLPARSFHPANSLPVLKALVTPDAESRRTGRLQKEAIARMARELLGFPINPVSIMQRGRNIARRF